MYSIDLILCCFIWCFWNLYFLFVLVEFFFFCILKPYCCGISISLAYDFWGLPVLRHFFLLIWWLKAERRALAWSLALTLSRVGPAEQAAERWLVVGALHPWAERLDEDSWISGGVWFALYLWVCLFIVPLNKLVRRLWVLASLYFQCYQILLPILVIWL